jgi:predicted amidohydrolase
MQNLSVSPIQTHLHWESPKDNARLFLQEIRYPEASDLIVLPEMFTTGFSMRIELAAEAGHVAAEICRELAERSGAAVCGSTMYKREDGKFVNRLIFQKPGENSVFYDKKHLFTLAGEHNHFTPGTTRNIVEWKGWRILPLICYDLRFPVWSYRTPENNYDLLLYTANWPERRSLAWRELLKARAIENQSYVAGVNRTGTDGNGMVYSGDSAVIDYGGRYLKKFRPFRGGTERVELDAGALLNFREKLAFFDDGDRFEFRS